MTPTTSLETSRINTHELVVDFGKHKGELWTRVPADYLRWLLNQPEEEQFAENHKIAQAELDRRGTVVSKEVEISPHAIDKASLRVRKIWHETALSEDEGLYSWLSRMATEALQNNKGAEKTTYKGIKFVFKQGEIYPILKTVYRKK